MARLSEEDIRAEAARTPGWTREGDAIRRTLEFSSFGEAIAFVQRVARLADEHDHHPDILVEYKRVTLTLTSHDAQGLTARDFRLARAIPG